MNENQKPYEKPHIEYINVSEFLKSLPLDKETKSKLLLCIATIIKQVHDDTAKLVLATSMGLSQDDPKFNAFFNNEIHPVIELDVQTIYNSLLSLLEDSKEEK